MANACDVYRLHSEPRNCVRVHGNAFKSRVVAWSLLTRAARTNLPNTKLIRVDQVRKEQQNPNAPTVRSVLSLFKGFAAGAGIATQNSYQIPAWSSPKARQTKITRRRVAAGTPRLVMKPRGRWCAREKTSQLLHICAIGRHFSAQLFRKNAKLGDFETQFATQAVPPRYRKHVIKCKLISAALSDTFVMFSMFPSVCVRSWTTSRQVGRVLHIRIIFAHRRETQKDKW